MKIISITILSIVIILVLFLIVQYKPFMNQNFELIENEIKEQASIDHHCILKQIKIINQSKRLFTLKVCEKLRFYKWSDDGIVDVTNSNAERWTEL